jgi:hypothetical protein
MACGAIEKRKNAGTTKLFRIIVSESALLIRTLRNKRVIGGKNPPPTREIKPMVRSINNRIALDCALTDTEKQYPVRKTSCKALRDWTRETGAIET